MNDNNKNIYIKMKIIEEYLNINFFKNPWLWTIDTERDESTQHCHNSHLDIKVRAKFPFDACVAEAYWLVSQKWLLKRYA